MKRILLQSAVCDQQECNFLGGEFHRSTAAGKVRGMAAHPNKQTNKLQDRKYKLSASLQHTAYIATHWLNKKTT